MISNSFTSGRKNNVFQSTLRIFKEPNARYLLLYCNSIINNYFCETQTKKTPSNNHYSKKKSDSALAQSNKKRSRLTIKRERGCENNAKNIIIQNLVFKMFSVILFYKREKNKEPRSRWKHDSGSTIGYLNHNPLPYKDYTI